MKKAIPGALVFALFAGQAIAASHDRQLERWIMEKVASSVGDIRGTVSADADVVIVTAEMIVARPKMLGWQFRQQQAELADPIATGSIQILQAQ
ncbi:MAG: hypothetical protein WAT78_08390 [Rhizobiaceae bacterium]